LVSVVDSLLVLRNGQQVGFGPAEEMINAVRNLQVVPPGEGQTNSREDGNTSVDDRPVVKEATHDAPAPSANPGGAL
jgi:hypothetical protein